MPRDVTRAARYMTRFRCLGGDCEDTCCQGWAVPIDEPTHKRLHVLAADEPTAQRFLEDGIELTPDGPHFGRLRFRDSGKCHMLEAGGSCAIHARLGVEALFDVCATYPRYYNEVDDELELFGSISCPEVARLCLLHDDGLALDPLASPTEPRKLRNRIQTSAPYFQPYRRVRDGFVALLAQPGHPLSEKLFALLWFSNKLASVVHTQARMVPLQELGAALDGLREPATLTGLAQGFQALEVDGALAVSIFKSILDQSGVASDPSSSWSEYVERLESTPPSVLERIDACLVRYCQNHLYTTPYMLFESLFEYARELVWRATLLRFLLVQELSDKSAEPEAVDRRLVQVAYRFGRRVEHSPLFSELAKVLNEQGLGSFAHTVCFLKL